MRYALEPQRDFNLDDDACDDDDTHFAMCGEDEATIWAVYSAAEGVQMGDWDWRGDYSSRADAEAFVTLQHKEA